MHKNVCILNLTFNYYNLTVLTGISLFSRPLDPKPSSVVDSASINRKRNREKSNAFCKQTSWQINNLKQMMHICFHLIHKPKNQKVEKQDVIKI